MKKNLEALLQPLFAPVFAIAALVIAMPASAQSLKPRIAAPIDDSSRVKLPGSRASHSFLSRDIGPVDPATPLHAIAIDFSLTPEQKADLDALTTAQQDLKSPLYHQWLTPEQYGARFGLAASDVAAVESWLKLRGFTIDRTVRANNRIVFSGTAAQVEAAFGTAIHNFQSRDGSIHFAPATDLAIPSALASSVMAVRNLNNYLPKPHFKKAKVPATKLHPRFTDVNEPAGIEYAVTPSDMATIYDINKAYAAGYTGAGQTIAIIGQSYVVPSDITTFQSLVGVPAAKAPVLVLVPGTGTPLLVEGDETESDLDLEYSSAIAKGAQVYFVYTGSYQTGVGESLTYAVDERIANIVSSSYGLCEVDNADGATSAATEIADQDLILEQGVAQGQTFLSAAGDDGSVDCIEDTGDPLSTLQSAAVDSPASSPYNTALGGTQFPYADYTANASTYWLTNTKGGAPLIGSAKSYIPEQVWNDDDPIYGTSAGGGGASLYEAAPTWQTGISVGGVAIPTGPQINTGSTKKPVYVNPRLVPDISLYGSPNDPGLLICSSDPSAWYTGQSGSCANGFYDSTGSYLTILGGTSFDAPAFAGMLAIINQSLNSDGQGNINSALYGIASSSTATYASAFHDITVGSNACYDYYWTEPGYPAPPAPIPAICGIGVAATEWSAANGYDMASGLGSVDLYNLLTAWPKPASASLLATTTTLAPATGTPALSASDAIAITVASSTTPTGTVSVSVDGVVANAALALTNGAATYSFASGILGNHIVTATYSADTTHAASNGLASLYVGTTTPTFSIAATPITVVHGNSAASTVTITPTGGYTGLVGFTLTAPSTLANACAVFPSSQSVVGTAAVPVTFTIYTNINNCPSGATTLAGITQGHSANGIQLAGNQPGPSPWKRAPLTAGFAAMLFALSFRRRSRTLRSTVSFAFAAVLALAALNLSGCTPPVTGSGTTTTTTSYTSAPGTYALTVGAVDSVNPTLASTATIALTIQ